MGPHQPSCAISVPTYLSQCDALLCSRWHCLHRFSLYEPVEFINTFLKDKLEWNQVTYSSAYRLPFSLVYCRPGCDGCPEGAVSEGSWCCAGERQCGHPCALHLQEAGRDWRLRAGCSAVREGGHTLGHPVLRYSFIPPLMSCTCLTYLDQPHTGRKQSTGVLPIAAPQHVLHVLRDACCTLPKLMFPNRHAVC